MLSDSYGPGDMLHLDVAFYMILWISEVYDSADGSDVSGTVPRTQIETFLVVFCMHGLRFRDGSDGSALVKRFMC